MSIEQTFVLLRKVHILHWIWASCLLTLLFILIILARQVNAQSPVANSSDRLITVYDQGEEQTFITNKSTLGEALRSKGFMIQESDTVEPAASTKLVASNYRVNVYRARSVVVVDQGKTTQVITAEQSPKRIVDLTGSELYPEDSTSFALSTNPVADGGAGVKLYIDRATEFTFNLYGKSFTARSNAKTVGEMLKEKGVSLGENDGQSSSNETALASGMTVTVWRNGKQVITQEVAIEKPVEEIKDADRETGFREVRTQGVNGKRNVTYEIEMRNGTEISRKEIASVVTQEPIKEVVVIGTKSRVAPYSGGGNKDEWLTAAGIPSDLWGYVDAIVQKESGWNPNALNSSSGACGLAQALPCSKVPGNPFNPVDSLRWMNGYVTGRYGGWEGAYNFWQSHHWY